MKKQMITGLICSILIVYYVLAASPSSDLNISTYEIQKVGSLIWKNECNGKKEGLTSWNEGEEFASLGIGHFIWYPMGQTGPFKETFPELLKFFQTQGISLPQCIKNKAGCPWKNRQEFKLAQQDKAMIELRDWLFKHVSVQAHFMVERLQRDLPTLLLRLPPDKQKKISFQFYRMVSSPGGLYALIDYFNFKGAGATTNQYYQGCGWGLMQVLEGMQGTSKNLDTVTEFVKVAKTLLDRRIKLAPSSRKEERWRAGWFNRLDSYTAYAQQSQAISSYLSGSKTQDSIDRNLIHIAI